MEKSPEAFRTISEVAEALQVPPHVLRFWETRFAQVKPVKRGGGRRYYRPEDVRLLRGIRGLLYDDGMTIKGVQKILRERGVRHVIGLGVTTTEEFGTETVAVADPAALPDDTVEIVLYEAELLTEEPDPAEDPDLAEDQDFAEDPDVGDEPDPMMQQDIAAEQESGAGPHGPTAGPQPDDAAEEAAGEEPQDAAEEAPAPHPGDKAALAALVARLVALRARMTADPDR
ncbi:MAG: MerR family transcriptional regulator [Amaricoccus sp.]